MGSDESKYEEGGQKDKSDDPYEADGDGPTNVGGSNERALDVGREQVEKAIRHPANADLCYRDREHHDQNSLFLQEGDDRAARALRPYIHDGNAVPRRGEGRW
jgi:hypothetical protein